MTIRLVALMSVVLLLSLAAFALLMGYYEREVMNELPRTASAVGQAALRTLERAADAASGDTAGGAQTQRVVVTHPGGPEEVREKIETIRHVITTSTDDNMFTVREQLIYPANAFPAELPGHQGRLEACLQDRLDLHSESDTAFFIDVEDVHAKSDSLYGLILTIPKFTPTADAEDPSGKIR